MTRLNRAIKIFNDYDNLVKAIALKNGDNSHDQALKELRRKVDILVLELRSHGCRREY